MDCQTVFVSKSILTLVTAAWPLSIVGGLMDFAHTVIMNFVPVDGVLDHLCVTGSHDSMSFCLDMSSPVLGSEPWLLRLTDRLFPCLIRPYIYRWSTTQQSVLWYQCELGIRYLDLRIARKPAGGNSLFFAHGIYTLMSVKEALEELASWLDAHPKEVIIISCSHFESLTDEDHVQLVDFILSLFSKKLCLTQDTPTLRSCWSGGQQVILSYDDLKMECQHCQLWPKIPYWYADSPDPKKVIAYLEEKKHQGRPGRFYVSGLNLTEDTRYVLLHPLQNLRMMTMEALSPLLHWTAEQRPGPGVGGVNIVGCDFVGFSQFCSIVIGLNFKLLKAAARTSSDSQLPPG